LIEELGGRVQRELVSLEERTLLAYKENLLSTQTAYRELKEGRNDEVIKQNTLALKTAQERAYQEATEKALEMNRVYDRLKVDFKQVQEYSHELQLELKFLDKQTKLAKGKAESLEAEIRALELRREKETVSALQRNQSCKKLTLAGREGGDEP
jgi:myosin heavy subunit